MHSIEHCIRYGIPTHQNPFRIWLKRNAFYAEGNNGDINRTRCFILTFTPLTTIIKSRDFKKVTLSSDHITQRCSCTPNSHLFIESIFISSISNTILLRQGNPTPSKNDVSCFICICHYARNIIQILKINGDRVTSKKILEKLCFPGKITFPEIFISRGNKKSILAFIILCIPRVFPINIGITHRMTENRIKLL